MDDSVIKKYSDEMLEMYKKGGGRQSAAAEAYGEGPKGGMIVNVTTLCRIYPVANALVTVFTGNMNNMNIVDRDNTDESGQTRRFVLDSPQKSVSESPGNQVGSYANYNVLVQADGYADAVNMGVRVFPGVTSVQGVDMVPLSAAGNDTKPRVNEKPPQYEL